MNLCLHLGQWFSLFCGQCGEPLRWVCACGLSQALENRFCTGCGTLKPA